MNFLQKYKKTVIIIAVLLCITAIIATVDRAQPTFFEKTLSYLTVPIQKAYTRTSGWFSGKFNAVTNVNDLENKNKELKEKVAELESEVHRLKLIENENKRLTELLNIGNKYSEYSKVGATIIAKDPGNWYNMFIIDKGTKDGINKNMVVIASGGLVGKVIESGYNYSKVVSIIDETDSVSAKSLRTDDLGFVRGDLSSGSTNSRLCRMEYIDSEAEIIAGDEIITSNLSDIYPPGITIGYVNEVYTDPNTLTKYAIITPTVDFKHLETVLVITQSFEKEFLEETPSSELEEP